jgi:pyrroloquinoline quinone biosynthesis protein B
VRAAGRPGALGATVVVLFCFGAIELPASAESPPTGAPFAIVLGTAQDGGLPQLGGAAAEDIAARSDVRRRRLVASLLIVDPSSGERFLLDATPDIREQTAIADRIAPRRPATLLTAVRAPLFDAIALTHAHVGHYAGLLHFGREAYGAVNQRVVASERMAKFLETNGPWDLLVKLRHIAIERFGADTPVKLNSRLSITPIAVPHRDEYSDTFGFVVRGPNRSILWLPDIDKWERWDRRIEEVIEGVDVAYLDGTFFDAGELPGRAMSEVPHPFITESLTRFAALSARERRKIVFIHLNHTNGAATKGSKAERMILQSGMRVAGERERRGL